MIEHSFALIPFPDPGIPKIKITGSVVREGNVLTIHYALSGTIEEIQFPHLTPQPGRKNGLWQTTCFEFFLAFPVQPQYWEFNLSPSGDWNIYRMDAYRQISLQEEELIHGLRLDIRRNVDSYRVETMVDISPILIAEKQLLMGISSVIRTLDGHETYWALIHPSSQADFHQRESFILALEG
jgi:hypothetical protein